ncbi:ABC transporter ATP-binding protein [Microbacterium hatanonis]|uniref:ABC transporter ATP-binding protein n=1 Tax=Microbacterium hatanonis TaxID=404366 RepID=A0A5C8I4A0_9MICO|nr:ABC transporter ATP-binding protein [Microbacterium hatanonis]TXK13902.1 ABC transporter ATP-binding protein [Microbacterium hatanonis]
MRPVVRAEGLVRVFGDGALRTVAVDGVDLEVRAGEVVVVRGPSGSGKTTLLSLLAGIDAPGAGTAWIDDVEVTRASEGDLARLRAEVVGVIAQDFALVEMLTAAENVELPLRIARTPIAEREARVAEALEAVGLTPHARQRPDQLSGGQQQRVAIARALVHRPRVLLADEPTAQLDSASARTVMELIADRVHRDDMAAVVTTHDPELAAIADRVIEIHDGRLGAPAPTSRAEARRRRMLRGEAPA